MATRNGRRRLTQPLGDQISTVGEFIAAQRRQAGVSLRQLADTAGVSNPYLSQIERGLRRPSAEVLQQLASALRVSAETLYVRAGLLDPDEHVAPTGEVVTVPRAIVTDPRLTGRQKQVLLDVYDTFVDAAPAESPSPEEPPVHPSTRTDQE
ncbi:helix-turn-helix domain-containing protein [Desertihabitans aurantiacus]|uniref:helix-turn-helix domain-containing protein n=1 Tax=Desertihabitans aurantiacus TaxID=2282477 RepID=UPI001E477ADE|nr:helix-turn-helix transcriptional regulator [Desertihabitans aurantiacus]